MSNTDEWDQIARPRRGVLGSAGMGVVRISLLFGSAAAALALILAPIAEDHTRTSVSRGPVAAGLDFVTTGSVGQRGGGSYTIRRSVLQPSPDSVCIIRSNGVRSGDC